jgi:ribose transport system substrate-binding protein
VIKCSGKSSCNRVAEVRQWGGGGRTLKRLNLVVSLPNDNSYQREQAKSALATAHRVGAEVKILHADNDSVTQSTQLLEIVQSRGAKPDAILLEPQTATGLVRVAEAAVNAGIGWAVLNSDVDYLDRLRSLSEVPVLGVTRDHIEIGRIQARQLAAMLPKGGTVLYVQGPATNSAANQRTTGLESLKPSNIHIKQLRSQWTEENAREVVTSWLRLSTSRAESIQAVSCQYDGIAMGARKAFQETLNTADRERWLRLPFTGVDGLPEEGQAWVNQGILAATVVAPTTTQVAIELLARAFEKGTQPPIRSLIELRSYPSIEELARKFTAKTSPK